MNNWGGKREGSGRKKMSESGRCQIQISLQQHEIDLIKENAKQLEMPVSRFLMLCVNNYCNK